MPRAVNPADAGAVMSCRGPIGRGGPGAMAAAFVFKRLNRLILFMF